MRLIILYISVFLFSCQNRISHKKELTAFVKITDAKLRKFVAKLKLIELQPLPPQCGIFTFALAQKFEIDGKSNLTSSNQIIAITPCPESYGPLFLNEGNLYQAVLSFPSMDTTTYKIVSTYKESKLITYWIEKIEILRY